MAMEELKDPHAKAVAELLNELSKRHGTRSPAFIFTQDLHPNEDWSEYDHDRELLVIARKDLRETIYVAAHEYKHFLDHQKLGDSEYRNIYKGKDLCTRRFVEAKSEEFARDEVVRRGIADEEWLAGWKDNYYFYFHPEYELEKCANKEIMRKIEI